MSTAFENPEQAADSIDRALLGVQSLANLVRIQTAESIACAAALVHTAIKSGNKILACGNGGSAAEAQHFIAELVGRFLTEREPLAGIALTVDTSVLTAVGNDYGYEEVFARQVRAIGNAGDVLLVMSTSGRSANVIAALTAARARGLITISLVGAVSNEELDLCDLVITIPDKSTPRVQEMHLVILHLICEIVDGAIASGD
ncbi:MAG: SIS domain-containing protein [Planctomycetota bacterium]|nr:SIS domain-containing protein [Planctomycetota bacterium]MDA1162926.1 SIS domain-containing protein [Planctomycetota bacterium]